MAIQKLRKDDPVYYKVAINKLIKQAKDNELKIGFELSSVGNTVNQIKVMFENDIGEAAGAVVYKKGESP